MHLGIAFYVRSIEEDKTRVAGGSKTAALTCANPRLFCSRSLFRVFFFFCETPLQINRINIHTRTEEWPSVAVAWCVCGHSIFSGRPVCIIDKTVRYTTAVTYWYISVVYICAVHAQLNFGISNLLPYDFRR